MEARNICNTNATASTMTAFLNIMFLFAHTFFFLRWQKYKTWHNVISNETDIIYYSELSVENWQKQALPNWELQL